MFTPQLNYPEKLLWFAFAETPARKTQSQPGRSGLSYLGACSGTLTQRWRRCVEASRASSSPCTSQWCSPSRWVGSCRGWWPHKRGQNMSVIEQTEQKKKSEKVITTLLRKGELYKHFGKIITWHYQYHASRFNTVSFKVNSFALKRTWGLNQGNRIRRCLTLVQCSDVILAGMRLHANRYQEQQHKSVDRLPSC